MEGEKCGSELDAWRKRRSELEYGEEGRVSEEEFGGRGREVEVGFEKRSEGEREGFGFGNGGVRLRLRLRQYLVLEGDGFMEVLLSFYGKVKVRVSDPLHLRVHEGTDGIQTLGMFGGAQSH